MFRLCELETEAFSGSSIVEVDAVISSGLEEIQPPDALIQSFSQPFPVRVRDKPVLNGEMDSNG